MLNKIQKELKNKRIILSNTDVISDFLTINNLFQTAYNT